jgi:hypothetical protein
MLMDLNPITVWRVSRNQGAGGAMVYLGSPELGLLQEWSVALDPSGPADPAGLQPELGTAIDYNQDDRPDILLHDVHGTLVTWHVLLTQPDRTFRLHDTGIQRSFPLRSAPLPPTLIGGGASMHLADMDGDRVPDLIQCRDHDDTAEGNPAEPSWKVHLWRPERGGASAGFDPEAERIEPLAGFYCDTQLYTADIDAGTFGSRCR